MSPLAPLTLLALVACSEPEKPAVQSDEPDVGERLGPGQVRAGHIASSDAAIGGVSSEGGVGDVKIYNDRVQFVIQDVGDSSFYVDYGGGLIDADVVRPVGEAERDMLDEVGVMLGLGRTVEAERVTVLDDGSDGPARVRVEGHGAPLRLVTGALESPDLVADLDLDVRTDFELAPDGWSLRVTTTVTNRESESVTLDIGDGAIVAMDVAESWHPGSGLAGQGEEPIDWAGVIGRRNEGAFALLGDTDALQTGGVAALLSAVAPMVVGFGPGVSIEAGDSAAWTRWIGVAPDLATLSGEQLVRRGTGAIDAAGTVTANGAPVAGARVHVLDADGAPLTLAFTDAAGGWAATVPAAAADYVATGRGDGVDMDLPAGHAWASPYDADPAATLASLAAGGPGPAFADGYGVGAPGPSGDLELVAPGILAVTVADGGPAVARVCFAAGDPAVVDERLAPGRPGGCAAIAFIRDGSMQIPVEPGDYEVTVHRGIRDELVTRTVSVASGETQPIDVDIVPAYALEGVLVGDPHTHASPSGDGGISMEERLLSMAANGVDVHFGTDHDHIADYRPLLAPLGLDGRLASIVADEVSPVLRGHFNAYPATATATANHGAPRWWFGYADTDEIFASIRAVIGAEGILQANHPVGGSGMFTFARYSTESGTIGTPDHWSDGFDAMEVLNSGDWEENLPFYLDLVNRGRVVTPVGVSDSHTATSGGLGANVTFLHTGTDLAGFGPEVLIETMRRRATVASRGPYVDARIDGAVAPGATVTAGGTLNVTVKAPSWMPVETVSLLENGAVVATEACTGAAPTPCTATWTLAPLADAAYVVIAASTTQAMIGAHPGDLAWAMTSALFVDVAGDGWEAPLPPLTSER